MANRQLTNDEIINLFRPLYKNTTTNLLKLSKNDDQLLWALRRKLAKELIYAERGKPMQRRRLKILKRKQQNGLCTICHKSLPEKNAVLDRFEAMKGYTDNNTRLICPSCDFKIQSQKKFK